MIKPELSQLRAQVLALYKTLLYYGRDYPLGYTYFRDRCHRAFEKNKDETDPQQIVRHLSRGEFIIKELEALYKLKKYRFLKQRYYPEQQPEQEVMDDPSKYIMKKFSQQQKHDDSPEH